MEIHDLGEFWHSFRVFILSTGIVIVGFSWAWKRLRSSKARHLPEKESSCKQIQVESSEERSVLATPERLHLEDVLSPKPDARPPPRPRLAAKRVTGSKSNSTPSGRSLDRRILQPVVFYFSLTDSTKTYASQSLWVALDELSKRDSSVLPAQVHDLAAIDYEDYFERVPKDIPVNSQCFYILLIPSYNIDTVLDNFLSTLQEIHHDFRIDTAPLAGLAGFSVFGFGDREGWPTEADGFCSQAIEVDKWMAKLTAKKRAYPLGLGDVKSDATAQLKEWTDGLAQSLGEIATHGSLGEGFVGSGDAAESDEESDKEDTANQMSQPPRSRINKRNRTSLDDLEDLGLKARVDKNSNTFSDKASVPLAVDFTTKSASKLPNTPKPMVSTTSPTHAALTKQGYTIIGSHSGVKICRWTKSALRGRGSCYKFSFYGIKSHLCMETTPSLSCSNKCVFCWRHGTNPVGTTWRWQVDPPEMIFEGAKEGHYKKIKMMKGVPGLRAERFQEAMRIRHCALSLVGEPIFYPHINEFISMLHNEHISSFLVCNAQHPDQLAALKYVTQLYVSIDASNAESLRKIDRPLHRDYWQRFLRCLDILRERRFEMRTVFRLTLVKDFNIEDEVEGYAELIARGLPCFVEIKGVTYCGTSSSAGVGLTMQNVPFYAEIVVFVEALNAALGRRGLEYGIAAEHAHSCCALIASQRFLLDGKWHTLIDYDRFFKCLESGKPFGPEDYIGPPTPQWATWGQGGFDPADERVYRKGKGPDQKARKHEDTNV